jgi:hypothetical protein
MLAEEPPLCFSSSGHRAATEGAVARRRVAVSTDNACLFWGADISDFEKHPAAGRPTLTQPPADGTLYFRARDELAVGALAGTARRARFGRTRCQGDVCPWLVIGYSVVRRASLLIPNATKITEPPNATTKPLSGASFAVGYPTDLLGSMGAGPRMLTYK